MNRLKGNFLLNMGYFPMYCLFAGKFCVLFSDGFVGSFLFKPLSCVFCLEN